MGETNVKLGANADKQGLGCPGFPLGSLGVAEHNSVERENSQRDTAKRSSATDNGERIMRCIDGIGWDRINTHNRGQVTSLSPPREWFNDMLRLNQRSGSLDSAGLRQTGRTTLMILKAMKAIKVDQKIPVIICHNGGSVQDVATKMTDWLNQVSDTLMFMYARGVIMMRDTETSDTHDVCYITSDVKGVGRGLEHDLIFIDNAVFDVDIRMQDVILEMKHAIGKLDMPVMKDERTVMTSDGEEFRTGDLCKWGNNTAMIIDIVTVEGNLWPHTVSMFSNGEIFNIPANNIDFLQKVE